MTSPRWSLMAFFRIPRQAERMMGTTAAFLARLKGNPYLEGFTYGIRPVCVGVMLATCITMAVGRHRPQQPRRPHPGKGGGVDPQGPRGHLGDGDDVRYLLQGHPAVVQHELCLRLGTQKSRRLRGWSPASARRNFCGTICDPGGRTAGTRCSPAVCRAAGR